MKKKLILFTLSMLLVVPFAACGNKENKASEDTSATALTTAPTAVVTEAPAAATVQYKDGTYEAQSEPDHENYYEKATVVIDNGKISSVDWCIYDAAHEDRPFDETYYEVFTDALYIQQSKDDFSGSRGYASKLVETQDLNQVDVVTGATWTNRKFKSIVMKALEQAIN